MSNFNNAIRFGELVLQNENIIVSQVQYRQMANRTLNLSPISRRSGDKFLSDEFGSKTISMEGHIISTSPSGLLGVIDNMQKFLALPEKELQIDSDRVYIATCSKAEFPELSFTRSATPFSLEFISSTPYSYGENLTAGFVIPSGVVSFTLTTTISGSVVNEPQLSLTPSGVAGNTGFTKIVFDHQNQGRQITLSGVYSRSVDVVLNYENATVSISGLLADYTGSFSKWDTGLNNLKIDFTGSNDFGVNGLIEYTPKYYL